MASGTVRAGSTRGLLLLRGGCPRQRPVATHLPPTIVSAPLKAVRPISIETFLAKITPGSPLDAAWDALGCVYVDVCATKTARFSR